MIHRLAWCDGAVRPIEDVLISGLDRTVLYGLGAFETVRLHGGRPFLFDRHLQRLQRSLVAVALPVPTAVAGLAAGVVELAARLDAPEALCRVTVTGGAGPDAAGIAGTGQHVMAQLRPVPSESRRPVAVGLAPFAHDSRSPLTGVKTTSYLVHYLQREQAEASGRLDDLMVDLDGHVTEGTVSNAFAVRDGRLVTPPVSVGILAGITRGVVLELAAELRLRVEERPLPVAELARVDEFFLTGAGKCLVAADVLDGRILPAARPVTTALREALIRRIATACGVSPASIRF